MAAYRGFRRSIVYVVALASIWGMSSSYAYPVSGLETELTQPDGTPVPVRVYGDEYYQRIESPAGYTLIRDPDTQRICYADLTSDGLSWRSTGVDAGTPPPAFLRTGLRLDESRVAALVTAARREAGQPGASADKLNYPVPATSGVVRGIALLVDFSDQPATVPPADIEAMLNQEQYDAGGNNGSVRDYYLDVSAGELDLTHEVTTYYYRAAHPKAWYEDPNQSFGWRPRLLVTEALEDLDRRQFDFSEYDSNGDGFVDLVSCFYAGSPSWSWGGGLWPQAGEAGFQADGVTARLWQLTPIRDELTIGTACHEIGHALCQWADLYDTAFDSRGLGYFCLMSYPGTLRNPVEPCGPLKYALEWTENIFLDGVMLGLEAPAAANRVFVREHPRLDHELFLIENRQASGRDVGIPDSGLAVWHVDWRGSNNRETRSPDAHYMVTLVQADGHWDLEHDVNSGDETDFFKAPQYVEFTPDTDPVAIWWRNVPAALHLTSISEPGPVMVFDYHDGIGRLPIDVVSEPFSLDAPWRITGADGYVKIGRGSREAYVPDPGSYLVTWQEVPGWMAPPAATVLVHEDGPTPTVRGTYSHPPFALTEVPALAIAGAGRGGKAVDFDDDGDLDLYLCRQGGADLLLRNDGGWQFVDTTPAVVAEPGPSLAAQWADVDADGDRDLYVVRLGEPDLLLRQIGDGEFGAAERLPDGIANVRGATWIDYDSDGRLDLHLVRDGEADLLLRAPDKNVAELDEYVVFDDLPGHSFARSMSASWCDYDADGRPDLYTVNLYGQNVLTQNYLPVQFANATHGGLGLPWRAGVAVWGDYDNDGDFDLYTAQDGSVDVLFTQFDGVFVMESGENTDTTGAGKDAAWADFDNDGDLDLYLARFGQPDRLLIGDGAGHWREAPLDLPIADGPTVAVVAADLDGDGGVDLTLDRDGEPAVLLHNTMNRGHWLQVDPLGRGTSPETVGAVLVAHAGDQAVMRHVSGRSGPSGVARRVHFGLGAAAVVDSLTVTWPNGAIQVIVDLAVDQTITVVQSAQGGGNQGELPETTTLLTPYPNPFNPVTNLVFDLARSSAVSLVIYDVAGRRVATVHSGDLAAGRHPFRWEGQDDRGRAAAAGVYVVRLVADGQVQSQRLTLVR